LKSHRPVGLLLPAACLLALAFGCDSAKESQELGRLREENRERAATLEKLQRENDALQDRVAQQSELLRTQTLESSRRSVD